MELLTSFGLIFVTLYLINKYLFNYWKRRGFKQIEPNFLFGNIKDLFLLRQSFGECFNELYEKSRSEKFIGVYFSYKPALIINDPEIVQEILINNFSHFTDRGRFYDEERDPISNHLFNVGGQKWRDMRVKFTPIFTSGKLKAMFPIIRDCGRDMQSFLLESDENVFCFADLFGSLTTNIIVSTAFGVDNNCFSDPENIFRKMSRTMAAPSIHQHMIDIFSFLLPNVLKMLTNFGVSSVNANFGNFVRSFVDQVVKHREEKNFVRSDLMQMLIELKNQGYLSADKDQNHERVVKKISIEEVYAQVTVFFVAGFDTSTNAMSFCLYELCRNLEKQKKVQEEIDKVFSNVKSLDDVTYEMIKELKYLQCCLDEALRLYPALPTLFRKCVKDFKIPGSDLIIEKGTAIHIPIMAIQRDPKNFENPLKFEPERHEASNGKGLYIFGDGPRHCIGMRMGQLVTKIGLASILWKFNVTFSDEKFFHEPPQIQRTQFLLRAGGSFNFKVTKRET